jgi:hypothetical protein
MFSLSMARYVGRTPFRESPMHRYTPRPEIDLRLPSAAIAPRDDMPGDLARRFDTLDDRLGKLECRAALVDERMSRTVSKTWMLTAFIAGLAAMLSGFWWLAVHSP